VVNVATVIARAVNAQGKREVLGLDVVTNEDGAGWKAVLRGLVARGLAGVKLVVSDTTGASSRPWPLSCPARPGRGAAPISCATC